MKIVFTLLALAFIVSCAIDPKDPRNFQTVEIISEPPGAHIEINGNYIGEAPLTTRIRCWPDDQVAYGTVTVKAIPVAAGQYQQSKVFQGPTAPFDPHHDVIPTRMLFDMNLQSTLPTENINLNTTNHTN